MSAVSISTLMVPCRLELSPKLTAVSEPGGSSDDDSSSSSSGGSDNGGGGAAEKQGSKGENGECGGHIVAPGACGGVVAGTHACSLPATGG
jgi:hypothetical protein